MLGDNLTVVLGLLLVVVLLFLNGLFVAAEFAYVTVRRTQMQHLAGEGNRGARRIVKALGDLDFYVAASQLGITMATIALGYLGEPVIARLIEPPIESLVGGFAPAFSHGIAIGVAFAFATTLHIVFGEFAPKSIALQQPGRTAMWLSLPMEIFVFIFRPAIWAMNSTGFWLLRHMGVDIRPVGDEPLRPEDLAYTLESSASAGLISRREFDLARNTLRLTSLEINDLMIPRTEIIGVPLDATREDVARVFAMNRFTRYPVYDGSLDNVVGIIDAKRMVYDLAGSDLDWHKDIEAPLILPESISIEQALVESRGNPHGLILVADEFGGIAGLLSLFDVVEFLAGHLPDEHEEIQRHLHTSPDGSIVAPGLLNLVDLIDELSIEPPEVESHTVGGMVMDLAGEIPAVGDEVQLPAYTIRVTKMDGNRVDEVVLIPRDQDDVEVGNE